MTKAKLLAFLLCEKATRGPDDKVTVHDIFDKIVLPQIPVPHGKDTIFFVYYKVEVLEPCVISLRAIDPQGNEVQGGTWSDSIEQVGLMQSLWALAYSLFKTPGNYTLELTQSGDIKPHDATRRIPGSNQPGFDRGSQGTSCQILATTQLVLEQQGG
ncbi:MAG TPA: hypothetical protein VMX16_01690 [Terriglobia bacterium]|nr:hypothetical protein [Terriglobia bacterium]